MNRVLGGGLVRGSVVLLAGDPGIGKSTLLLQLASSIANDRLNPDKSVVYISGKKNIFDFLSRKFSYLLNLKIFHMSST